MAVGDTPAGPFKDSGGPIEGLVDVDPKVFIDDDGQAYIYSNTDNKTPVVAKLKPNMIELAEKPRRITYAPDRVLKNEQEKFLEGIYMHKMNGKYYFSYTNYKNQKIQSYYAMGDSPYGPFEWKGALALKAEGAQDHHSVIEFKGQWYYFYHFGNLQNDCCG